MNSSFEMFNRSSYFPLYSYPLSVSSEISSSSYYPDNPPNLSNHIRSDRCLVCNDRSSGIHFGVSTCEACKAFFRRTSLSSNSIPQPCSPTRCEINIKTRNNCPSCRFDKCKRLGMDRENVIYGKPSKQTQQNCSLYDQNNLIKNLTINLNELIQLFENIHSINNKQQIEKFSYLTFQILHIDISLLSDIISRIFDLLFNSYKNFYHQIFSEYCLNIRVIFIIWLIVYYYQTFILKENICEDKLQILIKLLDIEVKKLNDYFNYDQYKQNNFRIHFINTFTRFTDLLQDIYSDNSNI